DREEIILPYPSWQGVRAPKIQNTAKIQNQHVEGTVATCATTESTLVHVANLGRRTEIARNSNLLSTKSSKQRFFSLSLPRDRDCQLRTAMNAIATAAHLSLPFSFCRSSKLDSKKGLKGRFRVFAVYGEEIDKKNTWSSLFDVEDPRSKVPQYKGKFLDAYQALEVARYDIQYCDWRARQDLLTIMLLHEKVVEVLNPLARDYKSIGTMKKDLAELQEELAQAHRQVHISEARVSTALDKLAYMEELVNDKLLSERSTSEVSQTSSSPSTSFKSVDIEKRRPPRKSLDVSGPVQSYHPHLKNFWYPIPIECFEEPWVIFRGKDGKPGCVQNTCAHRACPLHLGSVNEGRIQCPYHGWEYTTDGKCEKMPSTRLLNVKIKSFPCFEKEGMIWIWPGNDPPTATLPSLLPPSGFEVHAEIVMELPIEHGLLLDNLLDLAHAPFTHTSTFAKGWSVPSLVNFLTPASGLQGYWDPYPIDMEFRPPCMVLSTIGISKPGKLEGQNTSQCATHLHQLHVCLPSSKQKTRLLYRMSLDFAPVLKHVPFMQHLWRYFAEQVLNEDLRLVLGQQERMNNGANVWNFPVSYDKLGVRYRLWRDALERGVKQLPFSK
ncbi:Chlorophyllide a oxygenase, chloroplastic, partial [Mucuna pruriens]